MMTALSTLSLGLNSLEGIISTRVGLLTNLEGLMFYGQKNGGVVPSELGQLTHLRYLGLLQNDHTGSIPSEIWQLTNLDTLSLNYNPRLQGTLPTSIGIFPQLRFALFHACNLYGEWVLRLPLYRKTIIPHHVSFSVDQAQFRRR